MKLILFPLVVLISVSILSLMGLGTATSYSTLSPTPIDVDDSFVAPEDGWFDVNGHQVTERWYAIHTGEDGKVYTYGNVYYWINSTNVPNWETGDLAFDAAGAAVLDYPVFSLLTGDTLPDNVEVSNTVPFDVSSSFGIIALIVAIMAVAVVAGVKVLGSGIGDTSVSTIIKGTAFISLWAAFSVASLGLIAAIPYLGPIFYFFLTAVYTVGIMGQIGSGGSD